MEIAARPANGDELEIVVALCAAAHDELRPHRGGDIWSQWEARPEPLDISIGQTHANPDAEIFVSTIDDTIVGYAAVTRTELHDGRAIGHLTDVYVLADARGVGLGEAMMEKITEWCRARGCVGIDSIALPGDRATKNFFETFGLVARALRVHRAI